MEERTAQFRFDSGLREFLAAGKRGLEEIPVHFKETPAVKHLIEALGAPHTEIGALQANGLAIGLEYPVQPGDRIEISSIPVGGGSYPRQDATPKKRGQARGPLPGEPPDSEGGSAEGEGEPRFVVDNHLGRLAAYLRMLGLDTLYRNDYQDEELARVSAEEERILLTRDRRLLMRRQVRYGCCSQQLIEVIRRYRLDRLAHPFQRCLRCNHPLQPVSKSAVLDRLQPLTRRYFDEFRLCPNCNQVYWRGSHVENMICLIEAGFRTDLSSPDAETKILP